MDGISELSDLREELRAALDILCRQEGLSSWHFVASALRRKKLSSWVTLHCIKQLKKSAPISLIDERMEVGASVIPAR